MSFVGHYIKGHVKQKGLIESIIKRIYILVMCKWPIVDNFCLYKKLFYIPKFILGTCIAWSNSEKLGWINKSWKLDEMLHNFSVDAEFLGC